LADFAYEHPVEFRHWKETSNSIICLGCKSELELEKLYEKLIMLTPTVKFFEPDVDEWTSICLIGTPDIRKKLSHLPLLKPKKQKIMKELIESRRQKLIEIGKLKNDVDSQNAKIKERLKYITIVMRDVERKLVDEFNSSRRTCGKTLYPVGPLNNISKVSTYDGLIKIKTSDYECGSYYDYYIKVPLKYLDMSYDEYKEAHTKWVEQELDRRVNMYKGEKRNKKI
jgi:hypothetical protein